MFAEHFVHQTECVPGWQSCDFPLQPLCRATVGGEDNHLQTRQWRAHSTAPAGQYPPPLAANGLKARKFNVPTADYSTAIVARVASTAPVQHSGFGENMLFVLGRPLLQRAIIKGLLARYANIFYCAGCGWE